MYSPTGSLEFTWMADKSDSGRNVDQLALLEQLHKTYFGPVSLTNYSRGTHARVSNERSFSIIDKTLFCATLSGCVLNRRLSDFKVLFHNYTTGRRKQRIIIEADHSSSPIHDNFLFSSPFFRWRHMTEFWSQTYLAVYRTVFEHLDWPTCYNSEANKGGKTLADK